MNTALVAPSNAVASSIDRVGSGSLSLIVPVPRSPPKGITAPVALVDSHKESFIGLAQRVAKDRHDNGLARLARIERNRCRLSSGSQRRPWRCRPRS